MAHVPVERRKKFDARSKENIFVGYCDEKKGYRLFDKNTNKIIESRDVVFLESGNILNSNDNHDFVDFLLKGSEVANPIETLDDINSGDADTEYSDADSEGSAITVIDLNVTTEINQTPRADETLTNNESTNDDTLTPNQTIIDVSDTSSGD